MKPNHTIEHVKSNEHENPLGDWTRKKGRRQQSLIVGDTPIVEDELIGLLVEHINHGGIVIPDANIAINSSFKPLWNMTGRISTRQRYAACMLTTPVISELTEWLERPFRAQSLAADIRNALQKQSWIHRLNRNSIRADYHPVMSHYLDMMAKRRDRAIPRPDGTSILEEPYNRDQVLSAIMTQFGQRTFRIAMKGLADFEKRGAINTKDEEHILLATFNAIQTGIATIILTADFDLYEIFFKLQYLLDTHYRCWLVGFGIKNGVYERTANVPTTNLFTADCELYHKRTPEFTEVIPDDYASVPVSVYYLPPNQKRMFVLTVFFVRDLNKMFWTKANAEGRNTLQFGNRNVQVDLRIMGDGYSGQIALGEEIMLPGVRWRWPLSYFDVFHCLLSEERHVKFAPSPTDTAP